MFRDLPQYELRSDRDIPWMPPLPRHWSIERGKALFRRVQREPNASDGVVTCFRDGVVTLRSRRRTTGFTESLKEIGYQGIRRGDLVIHAMDAFAGAVGVSDSDGKGTPVYSVCVPRGKANPYYFAGVVREMARTSWIHSLAKGVRERSTDFRFDAFAVQQLPVPPVEEQAAIVKYLAHANTRIDKAIAAKRRLIALLEEQMASSIDEAIMRSMTSSESRVIPLKYLVVGGLRYGANEVAEGTSRELPRYIRITDFGKDGRLRDETFVSIGQEIADKYPVLPGDILLARSGATVGKAFLAPHEIGPACHAGYLIRARCNSQKLLPNYLYAFTRSTRFAKWRSETLIQSTIENISAEKYGALKVPVPPINVQHAVVEGVKRAHDETEHAVNKARREIFLLEEFRTRLVADAVTGQIDVRAIAATLPDAPADSMNRDVDTPAVDGGFDVDVSRGVA